MNKAHYDKWGDPLPELKQAIAEQYLQRIPETMFKPQLRGKGLHSVWLFTGLAEDVLKSMPDNITLSVADGNINFHREEIKVDDYAALTGDALSEYVKDPGPANLDELLDNGLRASTFKEFLQ